MTVVARDIMERTVRSVNPETPLLAVHDVLVNRQLDGLPVVDDSDQLLGVVTAADLLTKGSGLHLPTLQQVFAKLPIERGNPSDFKKNIEEVVNLKVKDVMDPHVVTLPEEASLEKVIEAFRKHLGTTPIIIVDRKKHVVGSINRADILKPFLWLHND